MLRKCLSYQSKEVYDMIISGKVYVPDISKCREGADGIAKVWCFDVTDKNYVSFLSGELFERFRCEMSLDQEHGFDGFYLFELELDSDILSWCDAHNACSFAYVFDVMIPIDVVAIYSINPTEYWYYKSYNVVKQYRKPILFPNGLDFSKEAHVLASHSEY